jgi:DNA-binding LacI/PurR family transcriptional regulator
MPFAREDAARLAGVSTATVPYIINEVLRSATQETQRRVVRSVEERHHLLGAIGPSLVIRKTDFLGFILPDPDIPKPIHARWPGLSRKPRQPLTVASQLG